MKEKEIIELLKSGDFTIIYWDNEEPTLYKGKWDRRKEYARDEYKTLDSHEVYVDFSGLNYLPEIVRLLTKALNGNADSI